MKRNLGQISVGSISLISSGALVIPITLPITATLANRGGAASDGVLVGSLTPSAITYAYLFDSPTYTDDTTDANSAGASDVSLYPLFFVRGQFLGGQDNHRDFSSIWILL